jgi:hypothetical protein
MTRTTASSRKTVAVAILALMIAVGALTTRTVHIVTAPANWKRKSIFKPPRNRKKRPRGRFFVEC